MDYQADCRGEHDEVHQQRPPHATQQQMNAQTQQQQALGPVGYLGGLNELFGLAGQAPARKVEPDVSTMRFSIDGWGNVRILDDLLKYAQFKGHHVKVWQGGGRWHRDVEIEGTYRNVKFVYDLLLLNWPDMEDNR